jgi:hypothetical protein
MDKKCPPINKKSPFMGNCGLRNYIHKGTDKTFKLTFLNLFCAFRTWQKYVRGYI